MRLYEFTNPSHYLLPEADAADCGLAGLAVT